MLDSRKLLIALVVVALGAIPAFAQNAFSPAKALNLAHPIGTSAGIRITTPAESIGTKIVEKVITVPSRTGEELWLAILVTQDLKTRLHRFVVNNGGFDTVMIPERQQKVDVGAMYAINFGSAFERAVIQGGNAPVSGIFVSDHSRASRTPPIALLLKTR